MILYEPLYMYVLCFRSAGACTAAAFLKVRSAEFIKIEQWLWLKFDKFCFQEFVKCESWAHIDIAGVMDCHGELPFLEKGMSGKTWY